MINRLTDLPSWLTNLPYGLIRHSLMPSACIQLFYEPKSPSLKLLHLDNTWESKTALQPLSIITTAIIIVAFHINTPYLTPCIFLLIVPPVIIKTLIVLEGILAIIKHPGILLNHLDQGVRVILVLFYLFRQLIVVLVVRN